MKTKSESILRILGVILGILMIITSSVIMQTRAERAETYRAKVEPLVEQVLDAKVGSEASLGLSSMEQMQLELAIYQNPKSGPPNFLILSALNCGGLFLILLCPRGLGGFGRTSGDEVESQLRE